MSVHMYGHSTGEPPGDSREGRTYSMVCHWRQTLGHSLACVPASDEDPCQSDEEQAGEDRPSDNDTGLVEAQHALVKFLVQATGFDVCRGCAYLGVPERDHSTIGQANPPRRQVVIIVGSSCELEGIGHDGADSHPRHVENAHFWDTADVGGFRSCPRRCNFLSFR